MSIVNKLAAFSIAMAAVINTSSSIAATLNFDDLGHNEQGGNIESYGGLLWGNAIYFSSVGEAQSGENFLLKTEWDTLSIQAAQYSTFTLNSLSIRTASGSNPTGVFVLGYRDSYPEHPSFGKYIEVGDHYTSYKFDFANVSAIYISSLDDLHIDDIRVNETVGSDAPMPFPAVPEPEAYAMLLAGLGLVGVLARRKRITT